MQPPLAADELELQHREAEPEEVAVLEGRTLDLLAVDDRTVGALQVDDYVRSRDVLDQAMIARDLRVRKPHVAARRAADLELVLAGERKLLPGLYLLYDVRLGSTRR